MSSATAYASGTQATRQLANLRARLATTRDHTPRDLGADDGPAPRMVSDNEGDIEAGLEENAAERQLRWFEC